MRPASLSTISTPNPPGIGIRSIQTHILRDATLRGWHDRFRGRASYRELQQDPHWRNGWISFDAVTWNPHDGLVYCGLNSMDGDLLYAFDPSTGRFESLGASEWTDEFDVKIHRTLLVNPNDRKLYFATSLLHDLDRQHEAIGGKLVQWDPATRQHRVITIPFPHLYIQSIAADWERSLIYCFTYPAEFVVKVDLNTGRAETLAYLGNALMLAQPHNAIVDRDGWLWGTCAETRAFDEITGPVPIRLLKYHPDGGRWVWFEHGLSRRSDRSQLLPDVSVSSDSPGGEEEETRHKDDYGFCDAMAYDGGRYIYAATTAGVLCRIDCSTAEVAKIANVMNSGRFPALALRDGILYGGGGLRGNTQLIRWDTRTDRIGCCADLVDPQTGERPARIHEIAVDSSHRLYLGENDNHSRSSYLWSVEFGS